MKEYITAEQGICIDIRAKNGIFIEIIMLYNVKIKEKHVDFRTNIHYSLVSTFEEGCLCIERSWAS